MVNVAIERRVGGGDARLRRAYHGYAHYGHAYYGHAYYGYAYYGYAYYGYAHYGHAYYGAPPPCGSLRRPRRAIAAAART